MPARPPRAIVRASRALVLALALLSCARAASTPAPAQSRGAAAAAARGPVYPGAQWERVGRPESVGWSSAGLDSVRARLAQTASTGMIAIVGGREFFEYGDVTRVSYLASVRKSILSMLFGNYVRSDKIDLNKTLAQLGIDDIGGLSAGEKEATIRDLLMARSGVYHPASNGGDDLASAPPRGSQKHGTYYLYNNWDFNAIGAIFEQETGRNIYDAIDAELARPIGMQDWSRAAQQKSGDSTQSKYLAYHVNLSTRDMARIGYLMLREGNWAGKQLVPRDWVRESTRPVTRVWEMHPERLTKGPFGYGYLWWVWDGQWATGPYEGAYSGLGAVGQHITVIPKLDLVVAHKTVPGQGRSVSHPEYLEILDLLVKAHCGTSCPSR